MSNLRVVGIGILAVLLFTAFYAANLPRGTVFRVYAIGTPDAYGNVILNMTIHQWNGASYDELLFWDNDTNWEVRVEPELHINITLWVRLNITFAPSLALAKEYTRVLCNITHGETADWTNEEFYNTDGSSDASFYYLQEQGSWDQEGKPVSGVTYNVVTRFEAYY